MNGWLRQMRCFLSLGWNLTLETEGFKEGQAEISNAEQRGADQRSYDRRQRKETGWTHFSGVHKNFYRPINQTCHHKVAAVRARMMSD